MQHTSSEDAHMICPHCGFENQEGRKYCRGCAKALADSPAQIKAATSADQIVDSSVDQTPVEANSVLEADTDSLSNDAYAGEFAAYSSGNKKLIAIVAVLVITIGGATFWFVHKSGADHEAESSTAQSPVNSVAYHPDAASVKNREHLMAALRLIVVQQEARLADDPDDLNVCGVNVLGNDELGQHVRASHYIFDQECQPRTDDGRAIRNGFTITATPKLEDNPVDAPTYCVDQTKIIRRYADSSKVNNATSVQHLTCPQDGQPVQ